VIASRGPICQVGISFDSASMATHVHTSPASCGARAGLLDVLLLRVDELPDLVALQAPAPEVVQRGILVVGADRADQIRVDAVEGPGRARSSRWKGTTRWRTQGS